MFHQKKKSIKIQHIHNKPAATVGSAVGLGLTVGCGDIVGRSVLTQIKTIKNTESLKKFQKKKNRNTKPVGRGLIVGCSETVGCGLTVPPISVGDWVVENVGDTAGCSAKKKNTHTCIHINIIICAKHTTFSHFKNHQNIAIPVETTNLGIGKTINVFMFYFIWMYEWTILQLTLQKEKKNSVCF